MPKKSTKNGDFFSTFNWQESYPSLILGAIIVIILGLLVANFLSKRGTGQIETGDQTQISQGQEGAPQAGSEYIVVANDSLSKISEKVYGDQKYWPILAKLNNVSRPNLLYVGTKLTLPTKEEVMPKTEELGNQETSYKVVEGDTFFTIAEKMYGDGSKWTILFSANGARRLPNGNPLVFSGTTIVVPR